MAAALTRPLGSRAVHLRITPRPSSLGESREIMRLISQFGEIEYFKSLKYDTLASPNNALVIYKDENAAQECLRRSPIRFRMGKMRAKEAPTQERSSSFQTTEGARPGRAAVRLRDSSPALPVPPPNPIRMPFDLSPPADPPVEVNDDGQLFQITTKASRRNFRDIVNAGHYHGGFAMDSKMPGQPDLAQKVPTPGLSCVDWKAGDRPWRVLEAERKRWGGKGSLGKMAGLAPPVEAVETTSPINQTSVAESMQPVHEKTVAESTIRPFSSAALSDVAQLREKEEPQSANDTLDSIMKGWGSMLPGGSTGSSDVQRYSGKRRGRQQ